ncbi:transposase [Treponema peruense]|uniref:Transposase n=1 Tax=Treponema peruense TaxID=2787628 RepID=A0A7T3RED0_9SPIR|nr:transposase [Treponema peruense]
MTTDKMQKRLKTKPGQKIYNKRKITSEPVFGIIKRVMGFRQFLMRGIDNISIE